MLALALALETTAAAQDRPLTPVEESDLASIDVERDAAHGLYVAAPLTSLTGFAMMLTAAYGSVGCVFAEPTDPPARDCTMSVPALSITGAVLAGLGMVFIIPAIILDVHSGHRRRQLTLGFGPTPGGLNVALAGRF